MRKINISLGHSFQISEFSQEFQVSERMIRNDLEEIPFFLQTKRGREGQ